MELSRPVQVDNFDAGASGKCQIIAAHQCGIPAYRPFSRQCKPTCSLLSRASMEALTTPAYEPRYISSA